MEIEGRAVWKLTGILWSQIIMEIEGEPMQWLFFGKSWGIHLVVGGAFYTRASCPNTRGIAKLYHLTFNIQYQVLISKSNLFFCRPWISLPAPLVANVVWLRFFACNFAPPPIWKLRTSLEKPYVYPVWSRPNQEQIGPYNDFCQMWSYYFLSTGELFKKILYEQCALYTASEWYYF